MELTSQRLSELLIYSEDRGIFIRRKSLSRSVKVGEIAGCERKGKKNYVSIYVDGKCYQAHRLAWLYVHGKWPTGEIDHINGICNDNRIANLRDVSSSMNAENRRNLSIRNSSGFMGVSWMVRANKWRAQVQVNGKPIYLGLFDNKELAYQAYLDAKRIHHKGCTI